MSISRLLVLVSFLPVLGGCSAATPETPGPDAGPGAARTVADYPLIPFPAQLTPRAGSFRLDPATMIILSDPGDQELRALARYAAELIRERTGVALTVSDRHARGAEAGAILLLREESAEANVEGYRLEASGDRIVVSAPAHAGLFYGIQTLRQLTPPAGNAEYVDVPAVEIVDRPRFVYRGMHLDVGRHFFPVSFVKKYIDLLAMYKMNTFHWHLTEDQGWRIEIKRYPLLTEVGAYRKETLLARNFDPYIGDRKPYGGFYTQDEVREVVAYAKSRYVNVIPEIELPGHSMAALAAYPELACTEGPFEVATVWGVHEDIYCPKEETFAFLEGVLGEIIELFPSPYVHIGGDEAPKRRWEESEIAQNVIRREGLRDEHELQSYFIRRIESYLVAHGRRLIGWDEILEGGLAPQATVMSWRGTAGGIEAARQGHDVIMTPTSHVYFDYYQGDPRFEPLAIGGFTPLEKVYEFEPVPEVLSEEEAQHVLGAQGNVWTEYMRTPQYVEYMVFPRMLALAEVVWSPATSRNWSRFVANLPAGLQLLDPYQVNYRVPAPSGLERDVITLDESVTVSLSTIMPDAQIRYTADGSDPNRGSPLYTGPFQLPVDSSGVVVAARTFLRNGRSSTARWAHFAQTRLRPAITPNRVSAGLSYRYFEAEIASVAELAGYTPQDEGTRPAVALQGSERDAGFALEFDGYIRVPVSGVYTFYLTSDDGSALTVASRLVIDNDGYHGPTERSGMIALEAGYHPISVTYFQAGGGKLLALDVQPVGGARQPLGADWLFH